MSTRKQSYTDYPVPNVVYVDVDGTLLVDDQMNQPLIEWIWQRHYEGKQIIVWSARGAEAARLAVDQCEIGDIVSHTLSKPGFIVDDLGHRFTEYMKIIHVNEIDGKSRESTPSRTVCSLI